MGFIMREIQKQADMCCWLTSRARSNRSHKLYDSGPTTSNEQDPVLVPYAALRRQVPNQRQIESETGLLSHPSEIERKAGHDLKLRPPRYRVQRLKKDEAKVIC